MTCPSRRAGWSRDAWLRTRGTGQTPAAGTGTGQGWLPAPVEQMVGQHQAVETAAMGMSPVPPTQPPREDVATPTMTSYRAGQAGPAGPGPAPPPVPSAAPGPARRPRGWILGAVALGAVLAVAGFVAASRLSAKAPVPPASTARAPAASPTVTSHPAPSPTPSPSGTGSAGSAGSGPAAVVQAYYAAINNHDCGTAWSLGGDNISAAGGETYQQFCQGFSTTSRDVLTVDAVAGDTVTVTVHAVHTDGSSQTFQGSYVVRHGVIDSASIQQTG